MVQLPLVQLPEGPPPDFTYDPPQAPYLDIVHQDEDVLLLDKPAGLLSVPGKPAAHKDCLELRAQSQFPFAKPVHRLDLGTSGLLLMGLNEKAHRYLSIGFERRLVDKAYEALVCGHMSELKGQVDLPLTCDWPNRPRQKVDFETGRPSQTSWCVIGVEGDHTRVGLTPLTGRSHQLRVHMASIGHPILGDSFYAHQSASEAAPRLMLHARDLSFLHPGNGERVSFTAPCPF
ncbi:MAG: RNA pseudouridine synthase [bacterium]|nr:RNA pseudouridine synthase [bacterium]